MAALEPRLRKELIKAWAHHGGNDEARDRATLGDVLASLAEHRLLDRLPIFMGGLKRPHQKNTLIRLAALLDSDRSEEAQSLLGALGEDQAVCGAGFEALFEGEAI